MIARLFAVCAFIVAACSSAAAQPAPGEEREIVYVQRDSGALHLDYYPAAGKAKGPRPVLIYMHGGAWARGQRPTSANAFKAFRDAGMAIVTVQYRFADVAKAPAAVQDVRCAMAWVAGQAKTRGLDAKRIVLTGTSAGGHLAMIAGLLRPGNAIDLPECRSAPAAAAILNQYGPSELREVPERWKSKSVEAWIGDGGDAMRTAMSPMAQLRAGMPPLFSAHGDADPTVPVENSLMLHRALDALKVPNGLYIVKGGLHGKFPPEENAKVAALMVEFLRRQHILH